MPASVPTRPLRAVSRPVDVPVAVLAWFLAFLVGQTVSVVVMSLAGVEDVAAAPIPTVFAAVAATWVAYLAGAWWASQRSGTGDVVIDYGIRFAPIDALGIPLGALTQLVVLPLVYWPLAELWPDTFSDDRLSETAQDLVDRASGVGLVLLVAMVCVFAPVVEEIVYRGMLQGSFAARFDHAVALVGASAWFALIHFRPVEYPGLFVFALVAGGALLATRRLGMSIVTHVAFNVTGLALVWR